MWRAVHKNRFLGSGEEECCQIYTYPLSQYTEEENRLCNNLEHDKKCFLFTFENSFSSLTVYNRRNVAFILEYVNRV